MNSGGEGSILGQTLRSIDSIRRRGGNIAKFRSAGNLKLRRVGVLADICAMKHRTMHLLVSRDVPAETYSAERSMYGG